MAYPIGMVGSPMLTDYQTSPYAPQPGPGARQDYRQQPWYRPGMETRDWNAGYDDVPNHAWASSAIDWTGQRPNAGTYQPPTNTQPQVLPPVGIGPSPVTGMSGPQAGTANAAGYTPPAVDPNSATAQNPFLNLGLNAFTQTQQPFDTSYLNNLSNTLYQQANQNYMDNLKPALDSNAIMAGGYGGDRAVLTQGVVMDRLNQNVLNAMAPQYAQAYESSLNRALQGGTAAAGVGQNLEQLDLSRLLGIGGLQNAGRGLDIQQQNANTQTAQAAANSAGVPTYTNPMAAGIGGAVTIAQLLNLLYG